MDMSDLGISERLHAEKPLVVIAGASGFVGQALAGPLSRRFRVVGVPLRFERVGMRVPIPRSPR